ncbi:MAG: DUF87 domain-containing protein [Schwartzia succinivorans]|nr:DUF87 domain-containing protein [Schwartzia succinivorans]
MNSSMQIDPVETDKLIELLNFHPGNSIDTVKSVEIPKRIGVNCEEKEELNYSRDVCFYLVKQLSYDEEYPHREAFENVLLSMDSTMFNFVYILNGTEKGIDLYIGVVKNKNSNDSDNVGKLGASDYGATLAGLFEGNFGGSVLEKLTGDTLKKCIFEADKEYADVGMLVGIPSENTAQKDNGKGFQGIDRLINSMLGLNWRLVIVAEPAAHEEISAWQQTVYNIYNSIAPFAKSSVQNSVNNGITHTEGENKSKSKGANYSKGIGTNEGTSHQSGEDGSNSGTSTNESTGKSTNVTEGTSKSTSNNQGSSQSMTAEIVNKNVQELLKYIDEELLKRIKQGFGRGLFKTAVYYMADNPSTANRLKVGITSLFQGESSSYSPLVAYRIDVDSGDNKKRALKLFQNISTNQNLGITENQRALLSYYNQKDSNSLSTWLTATELSLLAGMPQREIPGISVVEGVEFGLNANLSGDVTIGYLMQKGRKLKQMPLCLPKSFLSKHIFIAGVTGSGKTTTCHKLLKEAGVPFLVIEPAKTEYRTLIQSKDFGCVVFTVGDEDVAPFRFNPFELVKGENLSSHIDMLKATFTSAFPMEGSMPQLLEEAIYKCYEDKGWNVDTNSNDICSEWEDYEEGDEFSGKYDIFPILSDFLKALEQVVNEKNFDNRLRDDYIGTLVSRFSNLRKGAKGRMLNTEHSVDFFKLAKKNVIIELENLKSAEDKALIMGLILSRLSAVIRQLHREDNNYRHISLVEEAHRLLSKVEYGDSGSKKGAVETFTDLLAEVRKYGEGLIIVDQIPNKLAPEVIKNTNTKIIHKLLARDDKETVGDAMLMDDKQKAFLSALETGEAVLFTEKLVKPVHVAVTAVTDTNEAEISEKMVREKYYEYMNRSHPRIMLNKAIIDELYTAYNYMLVKYAERKGVETDDVFLIKINDFCQKYGVNDISQYDVCKILAKEKCKRIMGDEEFYRKLVLFTAREILGDMSTDALDESQVANLRRVLKEKKQ